MDELSIKYLSTKLSWLYCYLCGGFQRLQGGSNKNWVKREKKNSESSFCVAVKQTDT